MIAAVFDERVARRIAGASAVLLLHLIVIAFLLRATVFAVHVGEPARENIVWFVFPKPAKPKTVRIIPDPSAQSSAPRAFTYRGIAILPPASGRAAPGGLHALLFDCAPENLGNLSAEQRLQCASRIPAPNESDIYADHTNRSHDAALWARGRARKNEPLLLPCMPPGLGTLFCLVNAAKEGHFDLDNQPGYGDVPQQAGTPNGGDPPNEPAR